MCEHHKPYPAARFVLSLLGSASANSFSFCEERIKVLLVNILIKILHSIRLSSEWKVLRILLVCAERFHIFHAAVLSRNSKKKSYKDTLFPLLSIYFPAWILKLSERQQQKKTYMCNTGRKDGSERVRIVNMGAKKMWNSPRKFPSL